jgi:hypothetical protein
VTTIEALTQQYGLDSLEDSKRLWTILALSGRTELDEMIKKRRY